MQFNSGFFFKSYVCVDVLDYIHYSFISWSKFRTTILNGVNCLYDAKSEKLLMQVMQFSLAIEKSNATAFKSH